MEVTVHLAQAAQVCDLRARRYLGQLDQITFTVDAWQPSLFALLPEKPAAEDVVESLLEELRMPPSSAE